MAKRNKRNIGIARFPRNVQEAVRAYRQEHKERMASLVTLTELTEEALYWVDVAVTHDLTQVAASLEIQGAQASAVTRRGQNERSR